MASGITVSVQGQVAPSFTGMFQRAGQYIQNFRQTINTNLLNTMGAATMASKAIGYVTSTMREVTAEAKKFEQQSARLGVAPEEIAKLNKLSEESGVPFRAITKGLNQVKKSAAEALIDPNSKMAKTFQRLGIDAGTLAEASKDPMKVFGQISDQINKIGDDGEQLQALQDVFKQNGFMLKGMVEMGSAGQRELIEGNTTMGALTIAQNAELKDAWEKFWDVIKNGFAMFGIVLNPIVQLLRILLNITQIIVQTFWSLLMGLRAIIASAFVGWLGINIELFGQLIELLGEFIKGLAKISPIGRQALNDAGDSLLKAANKAKKAGQLLKEGAAETLKTEGGEVLDKFGQRVGGDIEDIKASGRAMTKGYSHLSGKEKVDAEYKDMKETFEAQDKLKASQRVGREAELGDWEKIKNLSIDILALGDEKRMMEKNGQKGTKEYYENLAKMQDKINERAALERAKEKERENERLEKKKAELELEKKIAAAKFEMTQTFENVAEKIKQNRMKREGKTEEEIKSATLDKEMNKLKAMEDEAKAFMARTDIEKDPIRVAQIMSDLGKQAGVVADLGNDLIDKGKKRSVDIADDARKRGMGGQVSTIVDSASKIPKQQLDKLSAIETNTLKMAEWMSANLPKQSNFATFREQGVTGATAKVGTDRVIEAKK